MDELGSPFEIKAIDEAGYIAGVAAAYANVDRGGDVIMPGALTKSVAGRQSIPMLVSHDHARTVGGWRKFEEHADGLHVEGRIALKTVAGQEAHALAQSGGLPGLSIGYVPIRHQMSGRARQLHELDLWEVSLVPVPMNDRSVVTSVKAISGAGDIADLLRERGMSGRQAKAAAGAAWKAINDTDNEAAASESLSAILKSSARRIAGL